jgi:hypothetical protein
MGHAVMSSDSGGGAAIWNPTAATNWSIVFTPVFGAYLQALNWTTLGEVERARIAKRWFYCSIGALIVSGLLGAFFPENRISVFYCRFFMLLYLVTWYYAAARPQMKYVKEKFKAGYPRRSLVKPLLIGCAAWLGYVSLVVGLFVAAQSRS